MYVVARLTCLLCTSGCYQLPRGRGADAGDYGGLCNKFLSLDRFFQLFCFQRTIVLELYLSKVPLSWVGQLGARLRPILGTLQGQNPPRVGKYKNFAKSPHQPGVHPPRGSR